MATETMQTRQLRFYRYLHSKSFSYFIARSTELVKMRYSSVSRRLEGSS